jgi:hypothetical protein
MNYRKMLTLLAVGAITACQGPAGTDGVAGADGETGIQGEQGVAGETGTDGQDLAAPGAAIASVAPNALLAGRTTDMRIVGYFTQWDDTTVVRLTDTEDADIEGVEVSTVVVSPVGLVVTATVGADVALGNVKLHVITGDNAQAYMPEGAEVAVTATATSSQTELRAGDQFDILLETAEYMSSPTLNADNCEGVLSAQMSRYSQHKFRVTGLMHPAMNLGDCAMALVQDAETDDEWTSAVVITITAPDVITFNEGVTSGELTYERQFRVVSVNAAAGEIVSLRHTVDEANNLDGTGPTMAVFVTGNTGALWQHDGDDSWFEVPSMVERELLFVVAATMDEGDDPVAFNLTQITPNTTMTVLQDGATQDQRLPANEAGANEAGRGSWYTFSNEGSVFASVTIAPENEDALQSRFALLHNDAVIDTGATSWEGVLPAGDIVLAVLDDEQAEDDGILSFAVELERSALNLTDENGAGTATVITGEDTNFLVDVPAGQVLHFTASTNENATVAISGTWVGGNAPIIRGDNMIWLPSAGDNQLLVSLSMEGDLGEGVTVSVQATLHEAAAFSLVEENAGEAVENTGAWFMGTLEEDTLLTVTLTPGTAEHMQPGLTFYGADGGSLASSETASLRQVISAGTFFVHVSDREFVAEEDQSFTANALVQSPGLLVCLNSPVMSTGENGVGDFEIQGNTVGSEVAVQPLYGNSSPIQVYSLTVTADTQVSINMEAAWDTKLWVVDDCNAERYGDWVAYNDDDYRGANAYDSAVSFNMAANTTVFVIAGGFGTSSGAYTLQYSLEQ